jgi:enoyl-CoA hydratase/carnithine racemase
MLRETAQTPHLRVTLEAGVLRLTLARPDKKNALTDAMYAGLAEALAAADSDPAVRVVLIEGEGPDFCAGNDIADFARVAETPEALRRAAVWRFLPLLARLEKPLIAAVTGRAIGVGVTMLLHCDLVYIAEDATLAAPFVDLGLVPEAGSSLLAPLRLGHPRAFALFALGEKLDGRAAAACGLVNAALPAGEVRAAAQAAAAALAAKPAAAMAAAKRLMRPRDEILTRIELENEIFQDRLASPEAQAAFAKFLKR